MQDLIQSVQRQVKTLIERKDAYNMHTLQDWNTFQWSRLTLLSDPAAKLIKMKVHCVGVPNPGPSNNWAKKIRGCMERTRIGRQRSAFIWHVLPGASNFDIKRLSKEYLNGQTPESFDERIKFMSMFNDIEWTKKGDTETCLHNAREVAAFATQVKPGHWCFLGPASENTWTFQRTSRNMGHCRTADG